jgi:hypothetical protein
MLTDLQIRTERDRAAIHVTADVTLMIVSDPRSRVLPARRSQLWSGKTGFGGLC